MREAGAAWLIRSAGVAAFVAAACASPGASAQQTRDLRICATQTESLADQRIAACTTLLKSGRLRGKPLGIAYELRGLAYLDRGDIPHAIGDLNNAIQLAPDFAPAYQNRGNAWYARGNYGQALADYDATIKLDPNSPSPYVNRATVRRDLGYTEGALEDYEKAISLGSDRASAYRGRGQLYLRVGNNAKAVADFDRALKLDPDVPTLMLRAKAREDSGDLNGALAKDSRNGNLMQLFVRLTSTCPSSSVEEKRMAGDYGREIYRESSASPIGEAYALALAANGKWDDAIKTQQAAMFVLVRNGRRGEVPAYREFLQQFQAHKLPDRPWPASSDLWHPKRPGPEPARPAK